MRVVSRPKLAEQKDQVRSSAEELAERYHANRAERASVRVPVDLDLGSGTFVKAVVKNLSERGFGLTAKALLHVDQRFRMHFAERAVDCEVRWTHGAVAGGQFTEQTSGESHPLEATNRYKQRSARRTLRTKGFATMGEGTITSFTLVDLSYAGCKIESGAALFSGQNLQVSILGLSGTLKATVRWAQDGRAGLEFVPDAPKTMKPRRQERLGIAAQISLRRVGRHRYDSWVCDLTRTGCKVEFVERPRPDELLWVKFEGLEPIKSKVRWVDGFFGGVEFVSPIHAAVFNQLLERLSYAA